MEPRFIASRSNRHVRQLRALADGKARAATGLWLVEGPEFVRESIRAGRAPVLLAMTPGSHDRHPDLAAASAEVVLLDDDLMRYVSTTRTGTGALAAVPAPSFIVNDLLASPQPLVAVLDGVQDPGNVGTVARSAEALGATGLVSGSGTADWGNPKVLRASAGALFHLPVLTVADLRATADELRAAGLQMIVAGPLGGLEPWAIEWRRPSALVLGSEAHGVSPGVAAMADEIVTIPHKGCIGSLNVAAAAAAILYEASRQRSTG